MLLSKSLDSSLAGIRQMFSGESCIISSLGKAPHCLFNSFRFRRTCCHSFLALFHSLYFLVSVMFPMLRL